MYFDCKVGDKVRCIETDCLEILKKSREYKILQIINSGVDGPLLRVHDRTDAQFWHISRFELIDEPKTPEELGFIKADRDLNSGVYEVLYDDGHSQLSNFVRSGIYYRVHNNKFVKQYNILVKKPMQYGVYTNVIYKNSKRPYNVLLGEKLDNIAIIDNGYIISNMHYQESDWDFSKSTKVM